MGRRAPRLPTEPMSFRIMSTLRADLEDIAEYKRINDVAELCRGIIADEVAEYRNNPRYIAWIKERKKEEGQVRLAS